MLFPMDFTFSNDIQSSIDHSQTIRHENLNRSTKKNSTVMKSVQISHNNIHVWY